MRKVILAAAAFGLTALAAMGADAQTAPAKVLWGGQSGGFQIRWATSDLTARGKTSFSFRPVVQARSAHLKLERGCFYERRVRLLSVVGPYVSLRDEDMMSCPGWNRPDGAHRVTTIDLTRPADVYVPRGDGLTVKNAVKLTDLFPEAEVLLNDPILKPRLKARPATLKQLLEQTEIDLTEVAHGCVTLGPDSLTRFAFHHVVGDKVGVRLALSAMPGACRGAEAELGLLLTVPPALREALALAQSGKQGFLMDKAPKGETLIVFRAR